MVCWPRWPTSSGDIRPGAKKERILGSALNFGWKVARDYTNAEANAAPLPGGSGALAPGRGVMNAVMVAEVMALAFVEVAGVLAASRRLHSLAKREMPVVARQDLADLRAALAPGPRAFLEGRAEGIRELFREEFGRWFPYFGPRYNAAHERAGHLPVELWDVPIDDDAQEGSVHTVRELMDQVLRPVGEDERIGQDALDVRRADSGGLDRADGVAGGALPLVVLELRYLGPARYGRNSLVDDQRMVQILDSVAGMARQGEAAAEFARNLPGSLEGQLVMSWLREAAAASAGGERENVAGLLRRAAGWYLDRFPDGAGELEMALGPVAEGLGVPGGFAAAGLGAAAPEPAGRWAQANYDYQTAYAAVRHMAQEVALPPAALWRLVGELAGLAGGGDVASYVAEVLGDRDILGLLGSIASNVPGSGAAELTVLVNDLLLAASLVPVRDALGKSQEIALISARQLADTLRKISQQLAGGQERGPVLAGTGYRAGQPLAERLTRLGLLNLGEPARAALAADGLFSRLVSSPLLGEALFAASGAEERFFFNADAVAAVDQVLLARVPTIAGLLVVGRDVAAWLRGRVAQRPGRPRGTGPVRPSRAHGG